jgi:DNA invertase Pin-like site-specific DNA recombinase
LGAAAELERGLIKARLQGGRRRKAAAGGYVGGTQLHRRYGYELKDGEYILVEAEQAAISKILAYRNASPAPLTWAGVAGLLNAQTIPPPSGAEWYPMTCKRIYDRELRRQAHG